MTISTTGIRSAFAMRLLGIGTLQSFSVPTNPEDSFHDVSVVGTSRITEK